MSKKKVLLNRIKILCIWTTMGIAGLSLQSLMTNLEIYKTFALGLTIATLAMISIMVALTVYMDED